MIKLCIKISRHFLQLMLFIDNLDLWSHRVILSVSTIWLLILKFIGQCDIKYNMMLQLKKITSVLKVLTYIITSTTAHPIGLAAIVRIMSVSTFNTAVILHVTGWCSFIVGSALLRKYRKKVFCEFWNNDALSKLTSSCHIKWYT